MVKRLKKIMPSFVRKYYRRWTVPPVWSGRFTSWSAAQAASGGYDEEKILDKVAAAVLEVIKGKAAFEKDSVLFYKDQFNWKLLEPIFLAAASIPNETLTVLDFGGSLGSSYLQNKKILEVCKNIKWKIIEQPHFVQRGRELFPKGPLDFCEDLQTAWPIKGKTFLLLASVLQYLPDPEKFLRDTVLSLRPDYIFIERTPFCFEPQNRLTVQKVPPSIYQASYPCWFFQRHFFHEILADEYSKISEENHEDFCEDFKSYFQNSYFVLKKR